MLKNKSYYYLEGPSRYMDDRKCNHCDTTEAVKRFAIGRKRLNICYACAYELMRMQDVVKEWVE